MVHDQATVTGQAGLPTPTGTVTFSWFTNGACLASRTATSSAGPARRVWGGGRHRVPADAATGGTFSFQASYSGDGTYAASTGPCEPLTVTKVASSTVTVIHDAAHGDGDVGAGGDDGARPGHGDRWPGHADGDGDVLVVHQRHLRGAARGGDVEPVHARRPGVADATGFSQTPVTGGTFAFQATYSGDATYAASTGACEPLTVTPVASNTVTVIHDAADHGEVTSVPAGTMVHDQATVTGGSGDADGDGDVLVVHQRHLHRARGGDVGPVPARRLWCRGRHRVPADARRTGGSFAFQASYSGDGTYDGLDRARVSR